MTYHRRYGGGGCSTTTVVGFGGWWWWTTTVWLGGSAQQSQHRHGMQQQQQGRHEMLQPILEISRRLCSNTTEVNTVQRLCKGLAYICQRMAKADSVTIIRAKKKEFGSDRLSRCLPSTSFSLFSISYYRFRVANLGYHHHISRRMSRPPFSSFGNSLYPPWSRSRRSPLG